MADEVDIANDYAERRAAKALEEIRNQANLIPTGNPGECAECGEYFSRLVNHRCGRCRDELRLR